MSVFQNLTALALRHLAEAAGVKEGVEAVVGFLSRHFNDHSQRLSNALQYATDRSWKALEVALAGESLKDCLTRAEDRELRRLVRGYLDAFADREASHDTAFRQRCLQELRDARKGGRLVAKVDPEALSRQASEFARYSDPQAVLRAELALLNGIAAGLREEYPNLAFLLESEPEPGRSLLVIAVRYFFRRAVEEDRALFQGLAISKLERLEGSQEQGFAALDALLRQQRQRLEAALGEIHTLVEVTHGAVLDVREQLGGQGEKLRLIGEAVQKLLDQHQLQRGELRQGDSLSIRGDDERRLVKQVVARYRALPEGERSRVPALLNAIGKLEVAAGEYTAARKDFRTVVELERDEGGRAEAHFNAYLAALEERDWEGACQEFLGAVRLDGKRLATFPVGKYVPERILGAGGFGVAFLCRHKYMNAQVVVKTLTQEGFGRDADKVFTEAQVLRQLDHQNIIRISECGYVEASRKAKPFLVMDYFDGPTLEQHVEKCGKLTVEELLAVARQVAEGLRAAHGSGIMHRDVKPANLLVRKGPDGWKVKVIDFGLALRQKFTQQTMHMRGGARGKTILGASIAGTIEFAAPEQMGRGGGVPVGPYSDVYGFAKACCFALFRSTNPLRKHWDEVPLPLAELMEACLDEDARRRPQGFEAVLERLDQIQCDLSPGRSNVLNATTNGGIEPREARVQHEGTNARDSPGIASGADPGDIDRSGTSRLAALGALSFGTAVIIVGLVAGAISWGTKESQARGRRESNIGKHLNQSANARARNSNTRPEGSGGKAGGRSQSGNKRVRDPNTGEEGSGGKVWYLSDLAERGVLAAEGRFGKNGKLGYSANGSDRIVVNRESSHKGLSMHAPANAYSRVRYNLEGKAADFVSRVALNDSAGTIQTPLTFQVFGDGNLLWESNPVRASREVQDCRVDVTGVAELELRVDCPGSHTNAQAVWLDPRVILR